MSPKFFFQFDMNKHFFLKESSLKIKAVKIQRSVSKLWRTFGGTSCSQNKSTETEQRPPKRCGLNLKKLTVMRDCRI